MSAVQVVLAATLVLVAIGVALVVVGVGMLWGTGWALIVAGVLLAATAVGAALALLWGTEK